MSETGFVKDGHASPKVARQYPGTPGKVGNVQIGVSVHAVTDAALCPLNWRLLLPPSWDEATADSEENRAQIPADIGHRPKGELALDIIDELTGWGTRPPR